ncbi:hypothetical protein [Spirosoma panaciterrae]|uniref:hypothetical protein n=1 Tax=Spirosoma panaciterrae TaxID=496058 RepID=UPI00036F4FA2|nr:hypothetical protein [Spirosoma panaciterrae]
MLTTFSAFLYRIASWKRLLLGVVLYIPFPVYIFKQLEAEMNALAGKPLGPIDLVIGYDPARVMQMVADYGPEARGLYAQGELTYDLAYPLIYTFLLGVILSLIFRNRAYAPFRLVNLVPIAVWAFDLLENACIVYLLKSYPETSTTVASLCSVLTNLKWAAFAVVSGLIAYGFVRLAVGGRQTQLG